MNDFEIASIRNEQATIFEKTYNNVGEGFKEIFDVLNQVNASGGHITVTDTFALQQAVFQFSMYQEMVTKVASKSATAVNDVMKAQ
ncbi:MULTISPECIES: hypothetical protein [Photorhabdus]|uniref:EscI/YscI/HrpB family type III secretion system inner rod protein n=2 Tax=Photorhabdus asymbiotica TaxID=291112 RepID=C7BJM6_PHOAA|nr:hypothetical protein [Photorhabdus asymbiotica]RKS59413.1 type III secretion system YscI/HrpB-like protein [Photorhabdus asymbiotica]CAQ85551.1 conserved hypothetical protein [Photorhabdus asymbiotica]